MARVVSAALLAGFVLAGAWPTTTAGTAQDKSPSGKGAAGSKTVLKNPVPPTPESIAAGRQVFRKNCVECHGRGGKGDGDQAPEGSKPANLTDAEWKHGGTDGEIFATIRSGVGPKYDMDGFRDTLSEKDIWNVINFIRSIGPADAKRD